MSVKLVISGQAMHYNQHYLLDGLDAIDQHPIEAIINLRTELDKKYIIPIGGIPASDLAETYISLSVLQQTESTLRSLYTSAQADIAINMSNIATNVTDITKNQTDIFNLTSALDTLTNKFNNLPGTDTSTFNSSVCIKQDSFEATDIVKSYDIIILDTDLKVIEPTVLDSAGGLLKNGIDYSVSYPDDITLRITFISNGIYKINYLSGEISDSEFNILLEYYKKLESDLSKYSNGSILKPAHDIELIYDNLGKVIQEVYTGNINKTIDYTYDTNDNITKKVVTQGSVIKSANYLYDANNKLISVTDDGTEIPVDGAAAKPFSCMFEYDTSGNLITETYTGDINKVITYQHNQYGDVINKSILEDGITKTAVYTYDSNRNLINISDNGTETIAVVFREMTGTGGSGTGTTADTVTEPEIDLIFNTIFI